MSMTFYKRLLTSHRLHNIASLRFLFKGLIAISKLKSLDLILNLFCMHRRGKYGGRGPRTSGIFLVPLDHLYPPGTWI